ncbi:MAG: hypothetical protein OXC46_00885 [Thaumarchaeota archaeon]|nr:hypothetical protein [Nitrososphaerota archaeon]
MSDIHCAKCKEMKSPLFNFITAKGKLCWRCLDTEHKALVIKIRTEAQSQDRIKQIMEHKTFD